MKRSVVIILGMVVLLVIVLLLSLDLSPWLAGKATVIRPTIGSTLKVEASAYSSSPYQTDSTPCITAVGTRVRQGVVAANFLPIGTIFSVDDDLYIVEDRMNSKYKTGYIDIWFPSTKEAIEFGRRRLTIKIEDYGVPGQALIREEDAEVVVQPSILERMNLRFTAYENLFVNSLPASVSGKGGDVKCSETR